MSRIATQEDVSVNQYLVTAIATYVGEADGISKMVTEAVNYLSHIVRTAWEVSSFQLVKKTPAWVSIPRDIGGNKLLTAVMSQPRYAGSKL